MTATSFASSRGRAFGIAIALAVSAALIASPSAFGAGDPVSNGKLSLSVTKGFKKELKRNGVRMGPKKFKIKPSGSSINPINGAGKLKLRGKLKFRGHGEKVVARKLTARIGVKGGNLKGTVRGRKVLLMRLRSKPGGAKVDRIGFGARVSRVSARLSSKLANLVNRKLDLNSLVASRRLAKVTVTEQPETVQVLGGTASTTGASRPSPSPPFGEPGPYPAAVKLGLGHCVDGSSAGAGTTGEAGIQPIAPATQPGGPGTTIFLPVVSGTISPNADDGNVQQSGGVRLIKNRVIDGSGLGFGDCTNGGAGPFPGELLQTDQVVRLGEKDVQSTVTIAGAPPGFPLSGNIGSAIGQTLDNTNTVVSADPVNRTITTTGTQVKITETSATTLNGVFPCVNNTALPIGVPCADATNPNTAILKGEDLFGSSTLTVTVR